MIHVDCCTRCGEPAHARAGRHGRHCYDCHALSRADTHDDCSCKWCMHAAVVRERQRIREDARTHGGLRADLFTLLGAR